jgi:hypothetical protein
MIVNKRKIPIRIIVNDIVVSRLQKGHPKIQSIKSDTKKYYAGYKGEKNLDYFLNLEKSNAFYNLQDIRLELDHKFFQMDSVVLSPYFILDLEVKNLAGVLKYDSLNRQMLQFYDGKLLKKYPDPILQSQQHLLQFKYWLHQFNYKVPPIENLVVMANPDVLIDFDCKNESTEKIIYPYVALEKILKYQQIYKSPILTPNEIKTLSKLMIEKHTPEEYKILKKFGLIINEILPGVRCPNCNELSMSWKYRTWFCPTCKIHSANAQERTIIEFLLINWTMTNKQCREFLCLPPNSYNLVTRMIQRMNLPYSGSINNRVYHLPKDYIKYVSKKGVF